jgi:hypothetical protein
MGLKLEKAFLLGLWSWRRRRSRSHGGHLVDLASELVEDLLHVFASDTVKRRGGQYRALGIVRGSRRSKETRALVLLGAFEEPVKMLCPPINTDDCAGNQLCTTALS